MEAKTNHNPLSARWRTREAAGIIQSESESLRIGWWCKFRTESKRPRTRDTMSEGRRRWESQFKQRDFISPPSTFLLFWSLKQTK